MFPQMIFFIVGHISQGKIQGWREEQKLNLPMNLLHDNRHHNKNLRKWQLYLMAIYILVKSLKKVTVE